MQRFTVFISSTVKDFAPVRRDLREWLESQGAVVRMSEDDDFPIDEGVTSHDACVRAVDGCHLMIVLVGDRYGGHYADTPKSITWREYDEALERRIPVVALVLRHVNEAAERWGRKELTSPPFKKDTELLVSFIDRIRKGHPDNWMHCMWDGSFHNAREIVQHRINNLFVRYQTGAHREVRERAERFGRYAFARFDLDTVLDVLERLEQPLEGKLETALEFASQHRDSLFGFVASDRWNLAIYQWDTALSSLRVVARRHDPRIDRRDRVWQSGEGHVGATWAKSDVLVAADLTVTSAWSNPADTDSENYRSAVAVPLGYEPRWGVLVVTSDRLDHFRDLGQIEVLTAISLAIGLERLLPRGAKT